MDGGIKGVNMSYFKIIYIEMVQLDDKWRLTWCKIIENVCAAYVCMHMVVHFNEVLLFACLLRKNTGFGITNYRVFFFIKNIFIFVVMMIGCWAAAVVAVLDTPYHQFEKKNRFVVKFFLRLTHSWLCKI